MVKGDAYPCPAAKKTYSSTEFTPTCFLRAMDPALKARQLNPFEFRQIFACVIPNTENPQRMSVEQLVRTTTRYWKVQIACGALFMMQTISEVAVGQFEKWKIESATHMHQNASVVMMGVSLDVTDGQLKQGLVERLRPKAAPELKQGSS